VQALTRRRLQVPFLDEFLQPTADVARVGGPPLLANALNKNERFLAMQLCKLFEQRNGFSDMTRRCPGRLDAGISFASLPT
jgi:hypothetical protein